MTQVRRISELEGAILSEIEHRGQQTAFQVRKAFADSFSLEWKGSAGAIYPAVRRLEKDGFLQATAAQGGRATRHLSLTAASIGVDPFRLRAGIWAILTPEERKELFLGLEATIEANVGALEEYLDKTDRVDRVRIEMAMAVQNARLERLRAFRD